jgi:hypothetical protein
MGSKKQTVSEKLFPDNFFARPDSQPQGDGTADAIYLAVGAALSNWEEMEEALASLYFALTGSDTAAAYHAIMRTYGSIESNTGRRKALESVAHVYLISHFDEDYIKKPFNDLILNISSGAKRRDDIAHGRVHGLTVDDTFYGHFLFPVDYNNSRSNPFTGMNKKDAHTPFHSMKGHYRYTSADISSISYKFSVLRRKIHEFAAQCSKENNGVPRIVSEGIAHKINLQKQQDQKKQERKEPPSQRPKPSDG